MQDFKYEKLTKNVNNYHPHAHFIIIKNRFLVFTLWNRGETSSTASLVLIRTSSDYWFPNNSVFTGGGSSLRSNEE